MEKPRQRAIELIELLEVWEFSLAEAQETARIMRNLLSKRTSSDWNKQGYHAVKDEKLN